MKNSDGTRNGSFCIKMSEYGSPGAIEASKSWIRKKALYYAAIGKPGIARLHQRAIDDFEHGREGKRKIDLIERYRSVTVPEPSFMDPKVRHILIPWTLNLQMSNLQASLVNALSARRGELSVTCLSLPGTAEPPYHARVPGASIVQLPKLRLWRWLKLLRWYRQFDLILQSDYHTLPGLSWAARAILFVNDEGVLQMPSPCMKKIRTLLTEQYLTKGHPSESAAEH